MCRPVLGCPKIASLSRCSVWLLDSAYIVCSMKPVSVDTFEDTPLDPREERLLLPVPRKKSELEDEERKRFFTERGWKIAGRKHANRLTRERASEA